jgi:epoxide hydrolase-like predicted phosphatase
MPIEPPQALLFDLGGVLVDIDFARALDAWAPHSSLSLTQLREAFKHDLQYERHERGEIDAAEYFDHLAATLRLETTRDEIARGWNAIFVGEIVKARKIVEAMREVVPCYAFTNTNASHMAAWSSQFPRVVGAFDRIFASHELALRKPEPAAFERICQLTGVEAAATVFFDDLAENVQAARDCGLQAFLVRSPEDIVDALRAVGLDA